MTRKMVSLFLALVMMLSLVSISAVAEEKTQVLVWTNARHDYDFFVDLINRYNAENDKNIEITMEVYTDNYAQALELAFDTGKGPDVFTALAGAWPLVQNGQGEPLNDYLTPEQYEFFGGDKSFVESVNMFDGKILSLPLQTSTPRLVYNKDLLDRAGVEKVPETFEEVVAAAKQVTDQLKGEGIYGFAINLKSPGSALGRTLDYMMQLNEGIREGYNFKTGKYEFERLEKISSYLKQMFDDGSVFPGCDQLDIDPLRSQFAAGRIAMYYSYTAAEPGVYANQFPTDANWDFGLLSSYDGTPAYTQGVDAGKYWAISKDSQNKQAAFDVLSFFESEEVLSAHYAKGLSISMIDSVIANTETPEQIQKHPLMAMQPTDAIWPSAPTGLTVEGESYYNVIAGYILGIPGYEDFAALAEDLNNRYNAALEKGKADGTVTAYVFPNFDPAHPGETMN